MGFTKDWPEMAGDDIAGSYILEEADPLPLIKPARIIWGDASALDPELNWAGRGFRDRDSESTT